jgi:succinyl-diaminopimelate desuccinylase
VFIAEPSENEVITAEMGAFWLQIKTIGRAAHIMSKKDGRNAMLMMLPILEALEKLEIPFIKHPVLGEYSRSPNTIFAGRSINTIPAECIVKVDQRTVPGQDHEQILHKIREVIDTVGKTTAIADFKAEVSVILDKAPIEADFAEPVLQKLVAIRNEITGAKQTAPKGLGGFSDAVAFVPALDVPFAICGPGNPALTHQANEWVQISKIVDSAKIYSIAGAEYLCE